MNLGRANTLIRCHRNRDIITKNHQNFVVFMAFLQPLFFRAPDQELKLIGKKQQNLPFFFHGQRKLAIFDVVHKPSIFKRVC